MVTKCKSLNELDYGLIKPGDLAVTSSGVHVMAYLGNQRWIAADPENEKVTVFIIPEKHNPYFQMSSVIVRWTILDAGEKRGAEAR